MPNLKYHLKDKQNHSVAVYRVTSAGQKRTGIQSLSLKAQHQFQYPVCVGNQVFIA